MRRFILVMNVSTIEIEDRRFFQPRFNIVSALRRTHGVLLVDRYTKQVFCPKELTYQPSVEPGIRQVDFNDLRDVTSYIPPYEELLTAIVNNSQDQSIRYFGRTLSLNESESDRFYTQLGIVA